MFQDKLVVLIKGMFSKKIINVYSNLKKEFIFKDNFIVK